MKTLIFKGTVVSGQGSGKKFLSLPWVLSQVEAKLGYTPFLGTLNLRLDSCSAARKKQLAKAKTENICPAEGYCVGLLVAARISGWECAVVLPQVKSYPEDMLEVIAPINLREQLQLKDGDSAKVSVTL